MHAGHKQRRTAAQHLLLAMTEQLAEGRIDTDHIERRIGDDDGLPRRAEDHGSQLLLAMDAVALYRQRCQLGRMLHAHGQHVAATHLRHTHSQTAQHLTTAGSNGIQPRRCILNTSNGKLAIAPAQITGLGALEIIHPVDAEQISVTARLLQHEGADGIQRRTQRTILGNAHKDLTAQLLDAHGHAQLGRLPVTFDRIANRTHQIGGIQFALVQIVLRTALDQTQREIRIFAPGQHNDGRTLTAVAQFDHGFHPFGIRQTRDRTAQCRSARVPAPSWHRRRRSHAGLPADL